MVDAALNGFLSVIAWPAIGYLFAGVLAGLFLGAVPGLSGLVGMAILLPFTFAMEPVPAFALLFGMFAVTTTSDTIASVLLGIPGTSASQATIIDGYPMAMRGEATRALGAAFSVSAIGGLLGAILLGLSIPIVKPLVLSFAQPEIFMLALLGLAMVGSLSGGSMLCGLIAGLAGLGLSYVGYAENGALPRYSLGTTYLLDGLPLVPVVLGLFAIPELVDLAARGSSISRVPRDRAPGGLMKGIQDVFRNWWLVLRSTAIGAYVGLLPGLGGSIVDWVAYGHAVQSTRDKDGFGKGDVRGVIAPETANNAMKGGALLPTIAFGIPGSPAMAILLGALLIQDLTPGPEMLGSKLNFTYSLMWTLAIANVTGALFLMLIARQLALVTFVNGRLVVSVITLFIFTGAWLATNHLGDWIVLLVFGVAGYVMKQGGVPRPPMVLGFVIGPIMENALFITNHAYDGLSWLGRPICMVIGATIVLSLVLGARWKIRPSVDQRIVHEMQPVDPVMSLVAVGMLLLFSIWGLAPTFSWATDVGAIPMITFIPAVCLSLAALWRSAREVRQVHLAGGDVFPGRSKLNRAVHLHLWWISLLGATVMAGQLVSLPLFIALHILFVVGYAWWIALLCAAGTWIFLHLLFDRAMAVMWYPSLLFH